MAFDTSGATIRLRLRGAHRLRQRLGNLAIGIHVHVGIDVHGDGADGVLGAILSLDSIWLRREPD